MLLKALYDLAHSPKRRILADDAFEPRAVRFLITLSPDGRFLGIQDTSADGKRGKEFSSVPKTARVKKGKTAEFLVDGIDSVFGLSPDPTKPKDPNMLRAKFEDFWSQIEQASNATSHPGLSAVLKFKPQPFAASSRGSAPEFLLEEGGKWRVRTAGGSETQVGGGAFTFKVGNDLLFEDEQRVKPYWRDVFSKSIAEQEQESDTGLCLITGENNVPIARTHTPRIRNIPGVGIDGTIVSFEKSAAAFSSYGKVQSNNAPCSVSATRAYSKALQFLVDDTDHHIRIEKTKLCFWTKDQVQAASLFARLLNQPQQDEVKKFMASPWTGIARDLAKKDQFFAVTLAGNSGRIAVRHWLQQPLDKAIENFHDWFADLELFVPTRPKPKALKKPKTLGKTTEFNPLSVYWLACATVREAKDLPPGVPAQLYRAALEGAAPSISLIKPILHQFHSKLVRDENYQFVYDESRFALLKLILKRNRKDNTMEITPVLIADTDDAAYNCGRLLAIFDDLQQRAHEWKLEGATIIERYFAAASTAPMSAFGILWRLHFHHLKKLTRLGDKGKAAAAAIEKKIAGICARFGQTDEMRKKKLPPEFPRTLDLQGQGRFALGFYQQVAAGAAARQAKRNANNPESTNQLSTP